MTPRMCRLSTFLTLAAALGVLLSVSLVSAAAGDAGNTLSYVPNQYIIHVQPGTTWTEVQQTAARMGGTAVKPLAVKDTHLIRMDRGIVRPSSVRRTGRYIAPQRWVVDRIQPNYVYRSFIVPNDEMWNQLWGMKLINAPFAWDLERGSIQVTVAVCDTGVAKHPELVDRLLPGYDFIEDDNDPYNDVQGHGTHVSGTIAAQGNNGLGVVGVCWDNVKIMPVRVLGDDGSGTTDTVIAGLNYALTNGAHVVNLSLGSPAGFEDPAEHAKVAELAAANIIVVAAAGNDNAGVGSPASFPECIAVSSIGPFDALAPYSNFGPEIDIAAPGGDSSLGPESAVLSTVVKDLAKQEYGYDYMEGTSMACPHVAGAAALLLSAGVPATEVRGRLQQAARAPKVGGLDRSKYGSGILDLQAALSEATLRIIAPVKGSTVAADPRFKIAIRGLDLTTVEVYVDYADLNGDGVPDNPNSETPVIDAANVNYFVNTAQTTISFDWSDVSSASLRSGQHFIYVTARAAVGGAVVSDWGTFTVASKIISSGIHLFSFPYKFDTRATFPSDVLTGTDFSIANPSRSVMKRWIAATGSYATYFPSNPSDITWMNPLVGTMATGGGYYYDLFGQRQFGFPAGAGFWLILPTDVVLNESFATLDAFSDLDRSKGYTVPLYMGWNMIGNPYAHSISWASALVTYQGQTKSLIDAETAGWLKSIIFRYQTSGTPGYDAVRPSDMLEPYEGYWVRALVGGTDPRQSLTLTMLP